MKVEIIFNSNGKTLAEIMEEDFLEFIEVYIKEKTKKQKCQMYKNSIYSFDISILKIIKCYCKAGEIIYVWSNINSMLYINWYLKIITSIYAICNRRNISDVTSKRCRINNDF